MSENQTETPKTEATAAEPTNGAPVNGTHTNGASAQQDLTPPRMAHQLFELALAQCKGNVAEASMHTIRFLTEAIEFTISVSAADNELSRLNLLKRVAERLMSSPLHPLVKRTTAAKP